MFCRHSGLLLSTVTFLSKVAIICIKLEIERASGNISSVAVLVPVSLL